MRNAKTIIIGIACAMALAYIISGIYDKAVGGDNTDGSAKSGRNVCIYDNGEYSLVDVEEYTASTLAGMMSDKWSDEMLKAVAVVVRTGIYYQMDENDRNSATQGQTKNLINESQLREIRYTESQLKKKWGGECSGIMRRAEKAVYATGGQVMKYGGEVILPAYHMISTGHTVSAQEIYGHDIPYLRQVASDVDQMAEDFSTTEIYSGDRLQKIFRKWIDADNMTDEVKVMTATESGFAQTINVFGSELETDVFKEQLGLASTNIHIDKVKDGYRIITVGVGDSLGMSLYGASVLAENGEKYDQILRYYYTGIEIAK